MRSPTRSSERVEVDRLAREGVAVRAAGAHPAGAAHEPADAGKQDGELAWLWQVVVGAGAEPFQDVFRSPARRQHQHRHELPGRTQLGDHGEAVLAGQHHVQHDGVVC